MNPEAYRKLCEDEMKRQRNKVKSRQIVINSFVGEVSREDEAVRKAKMVLGVRA